MTGTPDGAEVVGSAGPAPGVELTDSRMTTEQDMGASWQTRTLGEVCTKIGSGLGLALSAEIGWCLE